MVSKLYGFFKNVFSLVGIYIIWIIIHYISAQMYINLCVPTGLYGFLGSPFLAPALHCQALRWCIYNGGNTITHMWLTLGSWLVTKIMINNM